MARARSRAKSRKKAAGKEPARPAAAPRGALATAPRPRWIWWGFLAAAALATLAFFGSFVTDRDAMLFGTDMISQAYQSRAFAVQEVAAGRGLPRWNPFVYGGLPYLSILPYPVYYPTSLLYFAIPLHRAIGWAFVLHFLLAGGLAYGLARELRLQPGAAVVTGVAYMFTGYLVSHLYAGQDGRMFAMTWTPALFLLAERAITRRRVHWFLWLTAVVALQLFTPHVQMTYFAALGVAAYVAFRLIVIGRRERVWRPALILFAGFVGAYLLAGLIALVEIWPTLDMVKFSHRAARGYGYASSWAMPVQETLAMVWPGFQGTLETYWGSNPFKLHTEYLGAVPVLLAVLALSARRTAQTWFFAGLALAGLLFAYGGATPLHGLLYWTLPMMKSFRAPAMMFSVVALAVVVLAGYGAQAFYDRREALANARHPAWLVLGGLGGLWALGWFWVATAPAGFAGFWTGLLYGDLEPAKAAAASAAMDGFSRGLGLFALCWTVGLAACWAAARGRITPLAACILLAALTLLDLWRVDRRFYDVLPVSRITTVDSSVRFLQEQPGPFRALPLPDSYGPNDLMLFRIESVTGSQNFRLRWWDDLVGEDMSRLADARVWRLLNLQYLLTRQPLQVPELERVHEGGGPTVFAWTQPSAGAWFVHATAERLAGVAPSAAVLDPAFDPERVALLEPGTRAPRLDPAGAGQGTVRWVERAPGTLALDVETPADGLLVLSEIYHPYWEPTVDGQPVPLLQVDVALRGVPVPAGRHRVAMEFRDPKLAYGAWGSLVGLGLWAAAVAATWRRRGGPTAASVSTGHA